MELYLYSLYMPSWRGQEKATFYPIFGQFYFHQKLYLWYFFASDPHLRMLHGYTTAHTNVNLLPYYKVFELVICVVCCLRLWISNW